MKSQSKIYLKVTNTMQNTDKCQYLHTYPSYSPVTVNLEKVWVNIELGLKLSLGRGRCTAAQILTLIPKHIHEQFQ